MRSLRRAARCGPLPPSGVCQPGVFRKPAAMSAAKASPIVPGQPENGPNADPGAPQVGPGQRQQAPIREGQNCRSRDGQAKHNRNRPRVPGPQEGRVARRRRHTSVPLRKTRRAEGKGRADWPTGPPRRPHPPSRAPCRASGPSRSSPSSSGPRDARASPR